MSTLNPYNKQIIKVEAEFCGRPISLEVNRLAFQSGGAVTVTYGDTVVLGIANVKDEITEGFDYFPLSIDYEERMYAAGRISGSRFMKREGRPTDEAILTGRLIDRPIRPLFPKGFRNEAQIVTTVLSLDPELGAEAPAMIAASAAMMLTGAPFEGPVAGVRIGLIGDQLVAYPTNSQKENSDLDLFVAGTEHAIMMVEAGADQVSEEAMVSALELAHNIIQPVIQLQKELAQKVGVTPMQYILALPSEDIINKVSGFLEGKLGANLISIKNEERVAANNELKKQFKAFLADKKEQEDFDHSSVTDYWDAFDTAIKKDIRKSILENGTRPDGRTSTDIRPITSEVGILPRAHGSAIFTRGETQAINTTTLAPLSYSQTIDGMTGEHEERFFHHYNMPGYASGEIKRMGGTNRRETGHGHLAQRANEAVLPKVEDFPYAIRTVTEIVSSNGSTSMAATCSTCLSLMQAGVPISAPVSGIAMGLMMAEDGKYVILSDIMGPEDFSGDMDFKVAGTPKGITALQMDIKLSGLTTELLKEALNQAKIGRLHILEEMLKTISAPNKKLSPYAPRVVSVHINPEKIGALIGKGGENIQALTKETGTEIDIQDDGTVTISSPDQAKIELAKERIAQLTEEPEVGKEYRGKVVKIMEFGAFVNILPGIDGLVHISNLSLDGSRIEHVEDVVKEDQDVTVKIIDIDERSGKISLKLVA